MGWGVEVGVGGERGAEVEPVMVIPIPGCENGFGAIGAKFGVALKILRSIVVVDDDKGAGESLP